MIARKSFLILLNSVVGAVLGFVAVKLTSLYLGPEVIGEWDAAIGFLGLLYFVTDLGFSNAHLKRVSEGMDPEDCLATFAAFKAVATTVFVVVALTAMFVRVVVLGKPLEDAPPVTLLVALAYMAVKSVVAIPNATFDARRETARGQIVLFVETAVRVGLTVPVALLLGAVLHGAGPWADAQLLALPAVSWMRLHPGATLGVTWTVGALVSGVAAFAYLKGSTRLGRFRTDILRSYWVYALPIFVVAAIHVLSTYLDKAALAYFWSDVEVGRFSQPKRITAFLEGIPAAVVLLLFPTISAMHAAGRRDEVAMTAHRAERYISMVVFPIVVVLLVYPEAVIRIALSARWAGAEWTMRWLAVYSLFIALTRPHTAVLLGMDRPRAAAVIGAAMAAVNVVLILVLVPPSLRIVPVPLPGLADVGAALATAISGFVGFVLFRRAAARELGPRPWRFLAVHVVAAALMGALLFLLAAALGGPLRWWHLVLFSGLGSLAYLGVLAALREFGPDDRRFFRDALHLGDLGAYIRGELRRR